MVSMVPQMSPLVRRAFHRSFFCAGVSSTYVPFFRASCLRQTRTPQATKNRKMEATTLLAMLNENASSVSDPCTWDTNAVPQMNAATIGSTVCRKKFMTGAAPFL